MGIHHGFFHQRKKIPSEAGTSVYFPAKGKERSALNEVAILNPQWLLKALACFLYDSEIHKKKRFLIKKSLKKMIIRYEDTGILSRSLLQHLWQSYGDREKVFLDTLCSTMLLTSKYLFQSQEVDGAIIDAKEYVVPSMLKNFEGDMMEVLPDPEESFNAYIKFGGPMPVVIFERFVSEFVSKSSQFEGSEPPRLFSNFADVSFGENWVYLVPEMKKRHILVSTRTSDGENHMRRVVTFVSEIVENLVKDILGERFRPAIMVVAKNEQKSRCELSKLWQAIDQKRSNMEVITVKERRHKISIKLFSPFYREESDLRRLLPTEFTNAAQEH